jgi:hypothetical protein
MLLEKGYNKKVTQVKPSYLSPITHFLLQKLHIGLKVTVRSYVTLCLAILIYCSDFGAYD